MENLFVTVFEVESEAYQAFTEIKNHMAAKNYIVPRMVLIKKSKGRIIPCDGYDTKFFVNDAELGGLVGMFVGILGGSLGVLLGGVGGALAGSAMDSDDVQKTLTLLEKINDALKENEIAMVALVQETKDGDFAGELAKFKAKIHKKDAAVVAVEIANAIELQDKLAAEAKSRMHQEKIDSFKDKIENKRAELQKEFNAVRENLKTIHAEIDNKINSGNDKY